MSKTILSFIWTYSARQQIVLLILTIISFPILYVSLELPKQIINEAIGSTKFPVTYFGVSLNQLEYMAVLCGAFLLTVIISGVVKMRKNIYQGTVSERLLRRFRYQLIARILRFPLPHFRRTSQGALISMVTAETEPMGAMMGQAVSRPVFATGQMLTVAAFLFVQSVWLGLAAVLMIPLQAYIIPKLQRQINLLNKERILVIRSLSDRINESVSGVEELRNNNGLSHALADFSRRLGNIFSIRLKIYNKKFFMKFLNNFMNQLTPFFFLSIGGYLVIKDQLTVGALAAALAAHKELMTPWRDLLAFYSQIQDVSIRYVTITEQFTQSDMIDEDLFYGTPQKKPDLKGDIQLDKVTVLDQFDMPVLDHISLDIKQGSMIAIQSDNSFVRRALVEAMTRSVVLASGRITVAGEDLSKLHQRSIAQKIATAGGGTHVFSGTILDNLRMPLMPAPRELDSLSDDALAEMEEARRVGNSDDSLDANWLDPELAGVASSEELRDWWLTITQAIGLDEILINRALEARVNRQDFPKLTEKILKLRKDLRQLVRTPEIAKYVHFFDHDAFNPGLTVGENLVFAIRNPDGSDRNLVGNPEFRATLEKLGLLEDMRTLAFELLAMLVQLHMSVGTEHPMFQRAIAHDPEIFEKLTRIHNKKNTEGFEALTEEDRNAVANLPFAITAEQFEDAFPPALQQKILEVRQKHGAVLLERVESSFAPLDPEAYCTNLSILENIVFGRISNIENGVPISLLRLVGAALDKEHMRGDITVVNTMAEAGIAGANLTQLAREQLDFIRAVVRRPDVLILDHVFAGHNESRRSELKRDVRTLLPEATIIVLESTFPNPESYDAHYELRNGQFVVSGADMVQEEEDAPGPAGLAEKMHLLSRTEPFKNLDRRQLRLLAHGAHWVSFNKGDYVYRAGEPANGAYIFSEGTADLWMPETETTSAIRITTVKPRRIFGELSVVLNRQREFDLVAVSDLQGLCIGKQSFTEIIELDHEVTLNLLRSVSADLLHVQHLW